VKLSVNSTSDPFLRLTVCLRTSSTLRLKNTRKDLIHLYLLNYEQKTAEEDIQRLNESFRQYSDVWRNIRPNHVLVLIGGHRQSINYRHRKNGLKYKYLTEYLPKECSITFLDVGHSVLTSSIHYKSLTNYSNHHNNSRQHFQRTSFPCI
jgi:hypothetical protein